MQWFDAIAERSGPPVTEGLCPQPVNATASANVFEGVISRAPVRVGTESGELSLPLTVDSMSVLTRPLSAEHKCACHKTSDSEHGREHPEDREGKEEGEHDQDTTYTDQDSGHG